MRAHILFSGLLCIGFGQWLGCSSESSSMTTSDATSDATADPDAAAVLPEESTCQAEGAALEDLYAQFFAPSWAYQTICERVAAGSLGAGLYEVVGYTMDSCVNEPISVELALVEPWSESIDPPEEVKLNSYTFGSDTSTYFGDVRILEFGPPVGTQFGMLVFGAFAAPDDKTFGSNQLSVFVPDAASAVQAAYEYVYPDGAVEDLTSLDWNDLSTNCPIEDPQGVYY